MVTHYVDGQEMHRETIPKIQQADMTRFGLATIGNWSQPQSPEANFAIRNLNGCMDEFLIMSAALTEGEIKQMYEHGKP